MGTILFGLTFVFTFIFAVPSHYVDPELKPYVDDYMALLDQTCPGKVRYNNQFIVVKTKLDEKYIGMCTNLLDYRKIEVDTAFWNQADEYERRQLMYHELAHCVLNKKHVEGFDNYMYYRKNDVLPYLLESQVVLDMKEWCK